MRKRLRRSGDRRNLQGATGKFVDHLALRQHQDRRLGASGKGRLWPQKVAPPSPLTQGSSTRLLPTSIGEGRGHTLAQIRPSKSYDCVHRRRAKGGRQGALAERGTGHLGQPYQDMLRRQFTRPRDRGYRCRVVPVRISVGRESQSQEEAVKFLGRLGQRALRSGGRHRCLHAGQSRLEGRFLGVVERGLHHCAALALETLEHLICGDFAHEHE
jgi:hypothetical protein